MKVGGLFSLANQHPAASHDTMPQMGLELCDDSKVSLKSKHCSDIDNLAQNLSKKERRIVMFTINGARRKEKDDECVQDYTILKHNAFQN